MVIIKISGGLGNQMFQYGFGRCLSVKLNTELKFDIRTDYNYADFTKRSVGLQQFNIKLNLASVEEIRAYKFLDNKYLERITRKSIQKLPFLNRNYVVQDFLTKKNRIGDYQDNCYYDGYWQSERYFEPIKDIILKDFTFYLHLDSENQKILDNINSSESVSIHIRRGDYLNVTANKNLFCECTPEYYRKGINANNFRSANSRYFIFSDDLSWAKKNFKGSEFYFVETNREHPVIDMFLMSRCRNNIIANSTFSWWGAWLNPNPDKLVIAPRMWFNGKLNRYSEDIIPAEWLRI